MFLLLNSLQNEKLNFTHAFPFFPLSCRVGLSAWDVQTELAMIFQFILKLLVNDWSLKLIFHNLYPCALCSRLTAARDNSNPMLKQKLFISRQKFELSGVNLE